MNKSKEVSHMAVNWGRAAESTYKSVNLRNSYIEAIANSIDSIKEKRISAPSFRGKITIIIDRKDIDDNNKNGIINKITIHDNGVGFNKKNQHSFNTVYSSVKQDIGGKGLGRLSWIREATLAHITSAYAEGETWYTCAIRFTKTYDENNLIHMVYKARPPRTLGSYCTVKLLNIINGGNHTTNSIIKAIISGFLTEFIEHNIEIILEDNKIKHDLNKYFEENVLYKYGNEPYALIEDKLFDSTIKIYLMRLNKTFIPEHLVAFVAHHRKVKEMNLSNYAYFMPKTIDEGCQYRLLAWVESDILDMRVQQNRMDFDNINDESFSSLTVGNIAVADSVEDCAIRYSQFLTNLLEFLKIEYKDIIEQLNEAKTVRINELVKGDYPHFKLIKDNKELLDQLSESDLTSQDKLINKLNKVYIKEKTDISNTIQNARKAFEKTKNIDEYKKVISENIKNVTTIASGELAQYVIHRKTVIELLSDFVKRRIDDKKADLESTIHEIIFPMKTESGFEKKTVDYFQHNLWLVDERLSFHYAIASDKYFDKIGFLDGITSIDRPDILVALTNSKQVNKISSFILVEFKRPLRNDYSDTDNPIVQVFKYITTIRNGSFKYAENGRITPVKIGESTPIYIYIISDITPKLSESACSYDFNEYKGQENLDFLYLYHKKYNAYITILSYETLLAEAEQRNKTFFDILGIHKHG